MNCDCCSENIAEGSAAVKCSSCLKPYHHSCLTQLGCDPQLAEMHNWVCPSCKPKKRNADSTPVRNSQASDPNVTLRKKEPSIDELMRHLNQTLANYVNTQMKAITDKLEGVNSSIEFMNVKFEEMKTEFSLNTKLVNELKKENEQLKTTVKDLGMRLTQMEQQARSTNVEIQCLPEHNNENLVSTVLNISKVISGDINESNIHHVTRIAKQSPANNRPKSIVVQFSSPRVRDNFLAASINFNKNKPSEEKLNTALLGIAVSAPTDVLSKLDVHHPPILCELSFTHFKNPRYCNNRTKLNYHRADYVAIGEALEQVDWPSEFDPCMTVDQMVDIFYNLLCMVLLEMVSMRPHMLTRIAA
ncbi:hypothetical protein HW555_007703 [Spodoptera exigua]|uniref:PHD-type domain-containing protein n=1 Tax=Spodoptera exigua TaxID=7107 RepID=A0A835GEJ6_SPOEX|nr:hypothetical protein HW555_007703 [Spodoptera exigua]